MSNAPWPPVRSGLLHEGSSGRSLRLPEADTQGGARWGAAKPAVRAIRVSDAAAVSAA